MNKYQDRKYSQDKLRKNIKKSIKKHIGNAAKIKLFEDKYRIFYRFPLLWVSQ